MSDGRKHNGGAREGSGRPKGSTRKPRLSDELSDNEKYEIVQRALAKALEGDTRMLTLFIEQMYGKAPASLDADVQGSFVLEIAKTIADKNERKKYV